jgi:hypothetical protein
MKKVSILSMAAIMLVCLLGSGCVENILGPKVHNVKAEGGVCDFTIPDAELSATYVWDTGLYTMTNTGSQQVYGNVKQNDENAQNRPGYNYNLGLNRAMTFTDHFGGGNSAELKITADRDGVHYEVFVRLQR